ncbi:MAG: acyl-CoA dehydrogenase family protein [Azoarcus sp.]|jgi:alkylation response protein AidB-like acyl-CoA dehydrogenase|nr:acyl-CoA dehydrogenase family protein [Azoarcus sp.]
MTEALSSAAALEAARGLAAGFARNAAARDREGGTPKAERDAIRKSGLLNFTVAKDLGGSGGSWLEALAIVREIARADSSLAHVFSFHYYQLATIRLFGSREQWSKLHRESVEEGWFIGNALNPLNTDVLARRRVDGAYEWSGVKNFASGARDSDLILVSAREDAVVGAGLKPAPTPLVAAIPTRREGIDVRDDWDNIGQRQTDSGSVAFDRVVVYEEEILLNPGPLSSPFASLRGLIGQLVFANLFLSIAEGAFGAALAYLRGKETQPWFESPARTAQTDPFILRHFGELWVKLEAARALTEKANVRLDPLWAKAEALSAGERGAFAIAVATAKVATTQIGLEVANRIFEPLGARATASALGLDRFWRNLRTQTLHDPVDYKIYELGNWIVNGSLPEPTFYT